MCRFFLLLATLCVCLSCARNEALEVMESVVTLPETVNSRHGSVSARELIGRPVIVTYVDTAACTQCQMGIKQWEAFFDRLGNPDEQAPVLVFVVNSAEPELLASVFERVDYPFYFACDFDGLYKSNNVIPEDPLLRTVLIDSCCNVQLVGNPIMSSAVCDLYLSVLSPRSSPRGLSQRHIVEPFHWKERKEFSFEIVNESDKSWRIDSVHTSCECLSACVDVDSVPPQASVNVSVAFQADAPSHFMR